MREAVPLNRRARTCRALRRAGLALLATAGGAGHVAGQEPDDNPMLRLQYFIEPRAWPGTTIPAGALQRAKQQMRDRWPELFLQGGPDATAAFTLSTSAWTPIGPAPISNGSAGRVSSIAVHPADPDVIYIGGAQGGVWKSVDAGISWAPLTDDQCSLAMGSISIDPVDPRIVYAGTGELHFSADSYYGCGVLRSTDAGATWTRLGAREFASSTGGARISRLIIDPLTAGSTSATTVWAASSTGLWVSRDSGLSWTAALSGVFSDLQIDAADPRILYAARGQPATTASNGVYRSLDGGNTWSRLDSFPDSDVGRIALGASPSAGGIVYAAVQNGFDNGESDGRLLGVWRTSDRGNTWIQRTATEADCSPQCWYDLVVAVHPENPDQVWFGGILLYRSTDGAQTFQNVLRAAHVDQHAIAFDPSNPGTMYIGNDGGIYRSTNGAATWQSLNAGISITQFYAGLSLHPTDTTIVLGGTQDNGTLETRGTEVWTNVLGADGGFTAIDYDDPQYSWAETQWTAGSGFSGPRLRIGNGSFDRMANGIDPSDRALFIPPLVMDRSDPATLYFGTYRVYRTTSRGTTWRPISPDLTRTATGRISAIAQGESDAATIWVGTSDGNLQLTQNAGATWSLRSGGLPERYVTDIAVHGTDAGTAIVALSGFGTGHVFRTTDRGATWSDISGNLPDVPVNAVLADAALGGSIYIGSDLGVFRSTDNGGSWEPFAAGLPNVAVYDLTFSRGTGIVAAATHGRSVFAYRPLIAAVLAITRDSVRFAAIGDTTRLAAFALDAAGDTIAGSLPAWRSADETVATVDNTGVVTSIANGQTSVIAAFAGSADTVRVVVEQVAVAIAGLPQSLDLVLGETQTVTARAIDARQQTVPGATIAWTSSNPAVATVAPDGSVHAIDNGSAVIRASVDDVRDSTFVSVAPPSTAAVTASATPVTDPPLSMAGTALPLLLLEIDVNGREAVRITRVALTVAGTDPNATLVLVRDENGNGAADPSETAVVAAPVDLEGVSNPVDVTLQPADMVVEPGETDRFIVALRLSGESPNGARFTATYLPGQTRSVGVRSGAEDRLDLPAEPVASGIITSTVLGSQDVLSFSENPVRSERVIFNFREPPTTAAVYTVTGRRVIDLTRRIEEGGRIEWDLHNGNGDLIAPGVYLIIFDVGGQVMRERLIVIPPGSLDTEPGERAQSRATARAQSAAGRS